MRDAAPSRPGVTRTWKDRNNGSPGVALLDQKPAACGQGCTCQLGDTVAVSSNMRFDLPRPPIFGDYIRRSRRFLFDVNAGAKASKYDNFGDGFGQIGTELRALNYNRIAGGVDDRAWGPVFGAGLTYRFVASYGVRLGVQYEGLGTATSTVDASRINVPNTPSNVTFLSDSSTKVRLLNIDMGPRLSVGRLAITPSVTLGFAWSPSFTRSRLFGGPPGTVPPTTQVNDSTVKTNVTKFGVGWNLRAAVQLHKGLSVFAQYQSRSVNDVFKTPNEGRLRANVATKGVAFGVSLTFARVDKHWAPLSPDSPKKP